MKRIMINKIAKGKKNSVITREKLHSVPLGNGLTAYFSNLKKANTFISDTNKMLNNSAQLLNLLYIDLWTARRKIFLTHHWIFIRNWNDPHPAMIEKDFNLMLTRSHWTNGNHFTFKYFYTIMDIMNEWIQLIIKLLKENKKIYEIDDFRVIQEQCDYLRNKLDNWGRQYYENRPNCYYDKTVRLSE